MAKWRVTVSFWTEDYDADDDGDALMQADADFDLMHEARAEEILPDDEEAANG